MEHPKLTPERADAIINTLRDNPGVEMTLGDIADATGSSTEDAGAYLEDMVDREVVQRRTTDDGFDVYTFPVEFQRGNL